MVDQNRVEGALDQAKGAVKEGAGKLVGDTKLQTEGKADQMKGKAENTVGSVKDSARDAADKAVDNT